MRRLFFAPNVIWFSVEHIGPSLKRGDGACSVFRLNPCEAQAVYYFWSLGQAFNMNRDLAVVFFY